MLGATYRDELRDRNTLRRRTQGIIRGHGAQRTTCRHWYTWFTWAYARSIAIPLRGGNPREGTGNYMIMKCSWTRRVHTQSGVERKDNTVP